jgi:hypothetical protein
VQYLVKRVLRFISRVVYGEERAVFCKGGMGVCSDEELVSKGGIMVKSFLATLRILLYRLPILFMSSLLFFSANSCHTNSQSNVSGLLASK